MKIQIIVGSVMGTALGVAHAVKSQLASNGHAIDIIDSFQPQLLEEDSVILVCTSNTGMGDLPSNITPFYSYLISGTPLLSGRRYGIRNLGDSSYPNFAEAGKLLDSTLTELGAQRIGEALVMDAILVDDYDQEAAEWAAQWQELL